MEAYFEPNDYNKEGCRYSIGDENNLKAKIRNEKHKKKLMSKNNIRIKK